MYRIKNVSWWQEEMPNEAEYQSAYQSLDSSDWKLNYIFTHCGPRSIVDCFSNGFYQADRLTDFFEEISHKCEFDFWFFGHYHDNRIVNRMYILLYEQNLEILSEKSAFED